MNQKLKYQQLIYIFAILDSRNLNAYYVIAKFLYGITLFAYGSVVNDSLLYYSMFTKTQFTMV